ncbi:hypothetical protein [Bacillus alkalicellulosilyticus]|uniref:hypothetical protein n=1 Tax=Alkalihalobacterium alkalicellulosilyticum TaxID=1912214 RepID=UPI000997A419|nr:hypothetical protein [Bacillus alkalicellulosilyticus]
MLNGNKIVIILPLLVVAFLFLGGYHYIQQINTVTNEDLSQFVDVQPEIDSTGDNYSATFTWEWQEMPIEGLEGTDYIGFSFLDSEGNVIAEEIDVNGKLELLRGDQVIFESTGTIVERGIIFPFPNEVVEHESFGNKGQAVISFSQDISASQVVISYLHTWVEHQWQSEDPRFIEGMSDTFPHWVIERFVDIPQ